MVQGRSRCRPMDDSGKCGEWQAIILVQVRACGLLRLRIANMWV